MIEKKLIVCAIVAITIGIATIIPLEYLMVANAQAADAQALAAVANAQAELAKP